MSQLTYFFRGQLPANQPPSVSTPTASVSSVNAGTAFTAFATASDPDGTVASVEFFLDGVSKGVATAGPNFSISITPATTGTRTLTAQATDNLGAKSPISAGLTLTVTGASTVAGPPTGLTSLGSTATTVALSWTAPASNGGSPISDYLLEYRTGAAAFVAFTHTASTTTSLSVNGLTGSTPYDFRVSTVNGIGTSTPSTIYSIATPAGQALTASSSTPS